MTEEEYFIKHYPDFCYYDKPLSPYWDLFQYGVEFGERQSEKRITELEEKLKAIDKAGEHVRQQINNAFRDKPSYAKLEKENAELKLKLEVFEGQTPWKDIKDKSEVIGKLTKAKEIIYRLMDIINHDLKCFDTMAGLDVKQKAEQFLKEIEK